MRSQKRRKPRSVSKIRLWTFIAAIEGHGIGHVWAQDEAEAIKIISSQSAPQVKIKAFEVTGFKNLKKV